jgi:NADH:ubiquinone oxidoreductase subunit E
MPRRPVTPALKAPDEAFSADQEDLDLSPVAAIVAAVPDKVSGLIGILQKTQAIYGYLPEVVVGEVARQTGVPASRVYGVITFYAQFSIVPQGRHKVCVCQGTACHVRGGYGVLRAVENRLGIMPGETSDDMQYSLETVACLGACSFAPVMTVDGAYHAKMKGSKVAPIIDELGPGRDGGEA